MLKIGEFSKVCRVTIKTLRYYSDIGLLEPAEIDPFTSYRYYSPAQILEVSAINRYKKIGFTLEQIAMILQEKPRSDELHTLLSERLSEATVELHEKEQQVVAIEQFMNALTKEPSMETVTITSIPSVLCATQRVVLPTYDALYSVAPAMGALMQKQGAICAVPAYCFNLYHDTEYREKDIAVEICEAVTMQLPDADGIIYKEVAGHDTVAELRHIGSYETLTNSYATLFEWCGNEGYEQCGLVRESYIDGIWNKENPEEWLTIIQLPIEKKV